MAPPTDAATTWALAWFRPDSQRDADPPFAEHLAIFDGMHLVEAGEQAGKQARGCASPAETATAL